MPSARFVWAVAALSLLGDATAERLRSEAASHHRRHRWRRESAVAHAREVLAELQRQHGELGTEGIEADGESRRLPLVPYPASVEFAASDVRPFALSANTRLTVGEGVPETDLCVKELRAHLQALAGRGSGNGSSIVLRLQRAPGQSEESYRLEVRPEQVTLTAPGLAGLFYGAQTLQQLTPVEGAPVLPAVTIEDTPRLQWRGFMLDVSRHFFNATEVKKLISTMATFKFNHFHWHLTDDQGWRLPVKNYDKLTEVGARGQDGASHAYTMQEIKDVIRHAQDRHVTVMPEVDVPGHSGAAIAAYHELGNTDMRGYDPPAEPYHTWGVHDYTLGTTQPALDFLSAVFTEVADVFPGPFVHIGGDEAPTTQWRRSRRARRLNLEHTQSFFNTATGKLLQGRNKTAVAWDEAQHMVGLPDDAVILAWRSTNELLQAVERGHRVVNADLNVLYLDHYQGEEWREPKAICCYTPLSSVYNYDPVPAFLSESQKPLLLGSQVQLWSEYFPTFKQVEYMAFPRAIAFAERVWTPNRQIRDLEEFEQRLGSRLPDLDKRGVNYRRL